MKGLIAATLLMSSPLTLQNILKSGLDGVNVFFTWTRQVPAQ